MLSGVSEICSAGAVEVQETPKTALSMPGIISKVNPFNSPAQLSDISTVADWCSEPDEDVDEWQSEMEESDCENDLERNFPTLQASVHKRVQEWKSVGERLSSALSSCEVDSDDEDNQNPVVSEVQEWNAVAKRLSKTLSSCEVYSDEEEFDDTSAIEGKLKNWSMVGGRLSRAFMKAAEEDDDF